MSSLFFFFFFFFSPSQSLPCSPSPTPCPPFLSSPSFPFSSIPGCGHPSFQINCSSSSSSSSIIINSIPFLILSISTSSNSLHLSPLLPSPPFSHCPSLPLHPINLSSSPFLLLHNVCHSLPCSLNSSSSCSLSSFQNQLLSQPHRLFTSCHSSNHSCRSHPHSTIRLLNTSFSVTWNLNDSYFSNCSSCHGVCAFNDSLPSKPFLCIPFNSPRSSHRSLLLAVFFVGVFLVLSILVVALLRRCWPERGGDGGESATAAFIQCHFPRPPSFSYELLHAATNGFDHRCKIGDGGFGSVFLAHLPDGRAAAVKRLHARPNTSVSSSTSASFCNEIFILSSVKHPNLVRLHGYCCDPRGLLLVYDYVPNGTLADHIHHKRSLSWPVRVEIAVQIAAALEYLHFELKPPVVHRDVTSANIFVERDMRIKVGDFGLSRLLALPQDSSDEYIRRTGPQGTPGYLDPEYHRSFRLTEKSDVYSFGVVILELVTGMKAVDTGRDERDVSLAEMVVGRIQVGRLHQVVDPVLMRHVEGPALASIEAVAELAFRCLAGDQDDRPDSREVGEELKRIRNQL
ncbi:Non-specific serine/threonine protein kinase protein [Dioscorea alata]|uniref:Non-specific serine/threonine protein kinase protein n=1 Tax=Dioscorea alata TaxID=55571 RepID=A0ACB7UNB7_DIOAL|nr:Non-specific serine/threonine protein kinase protein [Dioscorea alata]